jgi:hypothetical protein
MTPDLEALVGAAYVFADEYPVPARPGPPARITDAELVALAFCPAMGISSDRQFLGLVGYRLPGWFTLWEVLLRSGHRGCDADGVAAARATAPRGWRVTRFLGVPPFPRRGTPARRPAPMEPQAGGSRGSPVRLRATSR